jgi:capsule polysaccharide modification protein KpsS
VQRFIHKYGVDFWIVERAYLAAYLGKNLTQEQPPPELNNQWLKQFPATAEAHRRWEQGIIPTLPSLAERCSVFEAKELVVLKATCIAQASRK